MSYLQRCWTLPLLLLSLVPSATQAHSRWKCPPPRNPDTGIKAGPCGRETNDFSLPNDATELLEIAPGPLRVVLEESIAHTGAPFRIALSGDGMDDTEVCVLLDHIPHNDNPPRRPRFWDESTFVPYSITVTIPDVSCQRCSLHLANPMTDKIGTAGAPEGEGCTDPDGSCFSVYHSCTLPFTITGSIPRTEYTCAATQPDDWPTAWTGDDGLAVDASIPGVYRREAATWMDGMLQDERVPDRYRANVGVCSTVIPTLSPAPTLSPTTITTNAAATTITNSSSIAGNMTEDTSVMALHNNTETNETFTNTTIINELDEA